MKKLQKLLLGMFAVGALVFSSCGGDDEEPVGPSLSFVGTSSADATVAPGETVTFSITASEGDANMDKISFRQSGNPLAKEKFTVGGEVSDTDGEFSLSGGDKNVFTKVITLTAGDASSTIAISVTDKDGLTAGLQVIITVEEPSTETTLATEVTGAFFHILGADKGAYDLVGESEKGSADADADKDLENNDVNPDETGKTFTGSWEAANSTMFVKSNSFDYANATVESATTAYTAGTASASVASPVVGDIYIAKLRGGSDYAVIKITKVDTTSGTSTTLKGTVEFSFKKK